MLHFSETFFLYKGECSRFHLYKNKYFKKSSLRIELIVLYPII